MKIQKDVGVSLGEIIETTLKEKFGEPAHLVGETITRHTGGHFVRVTYDRTPAGFRLKGEILLLEKLNMGMEIPGKGGQRGRRVDAVITRAAVVYPKYSGSTRVVGRDTATENTSLKFVGMAQYAFYRPRALLFEKVAGPDAQLLATGVGWDSFFRRAEVELSRRLKEWRRGQKRKHKSA